MLQRDRRLLPNGTMLNAKINATTDIKLPSLKTPLSEVEELS